MQGGRSGRAQLEPKLTHDQVAAVNSTPSADAGTEMRLALD